uniref:GH92 family glycosyl hydrolase n=1 Tax=Candidatus Cryptobacteroides bacterium TaxID=3085639 RepID=UPI004027E531
MKTIRTIIIAALGALAACSPATTELEDYTGYVNVRIGSGGHGHVFVGASVPFGAVQLGPTSIPQQWDWCSGYHSSDSTVIGFSHTHLSGTGIGDLFDITVMPVVGTVRYSRGEEPKDASPEAIAAAQASGMWSYADRTKEIAKPGYYSVPLTRYGITAEMTATTRVGLSRYTFPASDSSAVVFDLENGGCWDRAYDTKFTVIDSCTIEGYRFSTGWAKDQKIYFRAQFSKPFDSIDEITAKEYPVEGKEYSVNYFRADFHTTEGEQVMLKVAVSPASEEKAALNMSAELPGWDFEATVDAAREAWNAELSKAKVSTDDPEARTIFYTALYHTMIMPSIFSDLDDPRAEYTTFSLWDTYRAQMPLMTILHPERENDMVASMLKIYRKQGRLPVWHLVGNETDCMVGNPGVIAVADAVVKGFDGFDRDLAWEAMKATMTDTIRGLNYRQKYGYIPSDTMLESIAFDMEYAIADAAVAAAADYLGKPDDAEYFRNSSHSYRNYMDPETLFARGKMTDGSWRTPFNPYSSEHRANDYCEGNAWQYTWLAPHDYSGLVDFYGSREKFVERLDSLFAADSRIDGEDVSPDISGLIGQYAHGNEPSHHVIYFYTMAGEPYKTADLARRIYSEFYKNADDGLCGNEDAGQMSAWYALSALGFYEIEPASTRFWFGAPAFEAVDLKVAGGTFKIKASGLSDANRYIQSVTLNGKPYDKAYIEYSDIVKGGELVFEMGAEPAVWY